MSLDRIDSTKGYTQDNVRLVVHHINMAMSEYGYEALLALVKDAQNYAK